MKQLIVANGWLAIFVDMDPGELDSIMYSSPLVAWAMIECDYGEGQGATVTGLVAEDRVVSAQDMPDFLGYIGPGEPVTYYERMAQARLKDAGMINDKGKKCKPQPKAEESPAPGPKLRKR